MIAFVGETIVNADQIIEQIRRQRAQLDALGVKSLGLFGSVARGEARDDSDVDLLVAFDGPATFDRYMDLKFFLEELLGRRVDLVTERGLRKALRPTVERELRRVA